MPTGPVRPCIYLYMGLVRIYIPTYPEKDTVSLYAGNVLKFESFDVLVTDILQYQ